jgi:hypothetical protein
MRTLIAVLCATMLCGCGSTLSTSQLEPPAKVLMAPSPKLADPKAGDDLVQSHVELRRNYATETGKLARLQRYVRTILQK